MIQPVLKDEAFLADVRSGNIRDGGFRLWWLGQSGFLVQYEGAHLLLDPYLSDSLTKKYANTDKPHVRMTARVVDPAQFDFIDVATSSHSHTDHLDAETLIPLMRGNPAMKLIVPAANRAFVAERLSCDPAWLIGLDDRESTRVGPFQVVAVPAAHEHVGPEFHGYVVEFGRWTIYHSGDTLLYDDMVHRLREYRIDVALLPINGRAAERSVAGNLNAREAAELGKAIGARTVIPCHYEMFTFNTADPDEFAAAARAMGQPYHILRSGERWDSRRLEEE
jgi:L-ascorbate metabolism protein UlaG (beta-lactamase superfamily)